MLGPKEKQVPEGVIRALDLDKEFFRALLYHPVRSTYFEVSRISVRNIKESDYEGCLFWASKEDLIYIARPKENNMRCDEGVTSSAIVSLMREQKDTALIISFLLQQIAELDEKVERLANRVMILECIGEETSWS